MFNKKIPAHVEIVDEIISRLSEIENKTARYVVFKNVLMHMHEMVDHYFYDVPAVQRQLWEEKAVEDMERMEDKYPCVICGNPAPENLIVCQKCEKNNRLSNDL